MSAAMAREESDFAAFEFSQYVSVGGLAKWRLLTSFLDCREAGYGIKATPADNAYFCLRQKSS